MLASTVVAPRKYLFESPPSARKQSDTPGSLNPTLSLTPKPGSRGVEDEDVDYIRQLAAEEFAGPDIRQNDVYN